MAEVTGSIKDILDESLAGRQVEIIFRLNNANIQTTAGTLSRINPTAEARVTPNASTGFFNVNLTPTEVMLFDAYYTISIRWVDGKGPERDFPGWQLRVTRDGGTLTEMLVLGPPQGHWGGPIANLSMVLIALTQPENLQVGQLWLQASPGNHSSADESLNTGKLYRGKA